MGQARIAAVKWAVFFFLCICTNIFFDVFKNLCNALPPFYTMKINYV